MRGRHAVPGEVQGLGARLDGARAADLGGHGGAGRGAGRHQPGWRARRGSRIRRSGAACRSWRRDARLAPGRVRRPGGGRKRRSTRIRRCWRISRGWWSRPPRAIRSRRCAGPRRACGSWRRAAGAWAMRSAGSWWPSSWRRRATACRPTARPAKGTAPSGPRRPVPVHQPAGPPVPSGRRSPSSPWTRRRRNWSGDFKNAGREWRPKGQPEPVRVHDFLIPEQGKAIPYGVYDLTRNAGWVSVGIDHDTATLRGPDDPALVAEDGPPALSARALAAHHRGRRRQQRRAGAPVEVGTAAAGRPHAGWRSPSATFRPGPASGTRSSTGCSPTSARNWRGQPLVSLAVIVNLIGGHAHRGRAARAV